MRALLSLAALLVACEPADPLVVDAEVFVPADPDPDHPQPPPPAAECAQRWSIPASTRAISDGLYVPYQGATGCTGHSSAGAVALGAYLAAQFPGHGGYGIYDCRSIAGSSAYSLHAEGRAIDFMIPLDGGQAYGANNTLGDAVGNWLLENAEVIGVQRVIWDRTIWDGNDPVPKDHCVDISNPHWDHLHIELTWEAAQKQTPWFSGGATTPIPGGPGSEPNSYDEPPGTFVIDSNNANNTWAWGADVPSSWSSSSALSGYYQTGYWVAPTAFLGLDFVDFWFLLGEPTCLSAWGWWPAASSNAPDAWFLAYTEPNGHVSGWDASLVELGRLAVDQRTNGSQWNYLGSWEFDQTWNKISADRWTDSLQGDVVADAVRMMPSGLCPFVPQVAGQFVIDDANANNDTSVRYASVPSSWSNPTWVVPDWQFGHRHAPTSYWGLDFVDFHFLLGQETCLEVEAWWTADPLNAPDTYMLAYNEPFGPVDGFTWDTMTELGRAAVDQRVDGSRWNTIGTWRFPAGWNKISVDRWTESLEGWAVADAVRLTPSGACPAACADSDGDGATDCEDACPSDGSKTVPGECGCGQPDTDSDADGVADCLDVCPHDPQDDLDGDGLCGDVDGCVGPGAVDGDGDGICDGADACFGPGAADGDGDGVCDGADTCFGPGAGDADGDGFCDGVDGCFGPGAGDMDADGFCDGADTCFGPGAGDADGDGFCDDQDDCFGPGFGDQDADGVCDLADLCEGDDATGDSDGDGTCDDLDFRLAAGSLRALAPFTIAVHGAPPGKPVHFLASKHAPGHGGGPCTLSAQGVEVCTALPGAMRLGSAQADATGNATLTITAPAFPVGSVAWFQVVSLVGRGDVTNTTSVTMSP